ncbi:MAG: hypothetical protein ACMUHM_03090 [Thermoplasmatota archaeon]
MDMKREGKYLLIFGMLAIIIAGGLAVMYLLSRVDESGGEAPSYEFESSIDALNNTLTMIEPNRTVNWNEYLVVVNGTFVMRRSQIAVPGISTVFRDPDWDPRFGCCYDVEVLEKGGGKKLWNSTVEAN